MDIRFLITLCEGLNHTPFIDNVHGIGEVPDNRNVDYKGLRVLMRPSQFLALAAPVVEGRRSLEFLVAHLQQGGTVAAPFLVIDVPESFCDGDFSSHAQVKTHEGRHRMLAIRQVFGDEPVEVHLFFTHGLRSRDLKPEWIEAMQADLQAEKSSRIVSNNFQAF